MGRALAALLVLTGLCGQSWAEESSDKYQFTKDIPKGLPDFSNWEKIAHDFHSSDSTNLLRYELYVEPGRAGLYQIIRYRAVQSDRNGKWHPLAGVSEHICLNAVHIKSRYLVRVSKRSWKKLWLGRAFFWKEFKQGTQEFLDEGLALRQIFAIQSNFFDKEDYKGTGGPQ